MDKLFPIVRRVRRPLLPPDAVPPEAAAQAAAEQKPPATTELKPVTEESHADVAEE
jgi:hypothetical protein